MSEELGLTNGPPMQAVDVEGAVSAWGAYQELCRALLTESDYVIISGTKVRKRVGWIKLRRFLGISIQIVGAERWEDEDDWGWDFMVRATLPNGRFEEADGSASFDELMANWEKGGRRGPKPNRHLIRARALTRAKSRATADLIGAPQDSDGSFGATAQARREVLTKLQRDANDALHANGMRPYYCDAEHVAKTLKMLGYTSYKADLHDETVQRLVGHAECLSPVNGRTATESIAELFGDDSNGNGLACLPRQADFEEPTFYGEGDAEAPNEEMGAVLIDEETGEIVESPLQTPPGPESGAGTKKPPPNGPGKGSGATRPADPETVKGWLTKKAEKLSYYRDPSPEQRGLMNGLLSKILGGDRERRSWIGWTWAQASSANLTGGQVSATLNWLNLTKDPEAGEQIPYPFAVSECKMMLRQAMTDKGQLDLFDQ